jgi:hypothetical protein
MDKGREEEREVKPPCFIELASIDDVGRLACALERTPYPVFRIERASGVRFLAVHYELHRGYPIFYYAQEAEPLVRGHFLGYRVKGVTEEVVFRDAASDPTFIYAPVIDVVRLPRLFRQGVGSLCEPQVTYLAMELSGVAEVAKVAAYKVLYEEPPLPTFLYPYGDRWMLGTFARLDEYEGGSLFLYTQLDERPEGNFIRFSSEDAGAVKFTNSLEEHGYIQIKVIHLRGKHPLIRF